MCDTDMRLREVGRRQQAWRGDLQGGRARRGDDDSGRNEGSGQRATHHHGQC